MDKLTKTIEAVLFYKNEPISLSELASLLEVEISAIQESVEKLYETYQNRGVRIILSDIDVQMVGVITDESLLERLSLLESNPVLSRAAKETLATVLYLGPVEAAQIDKVRGVKSGRSLKNLERRGYVAKSNKKYSVTADALNQLNLERPTQAEEYLDLQERLLSLNEDE